MILLSGGMDSATTLAVAGAEGFECHALTIDYGQRARAELKAARRTAAARKVKRHVVLKVDLRAFGGSALTDNIEVPSAEESSGIPATYVPARNTVLLSLALSWAEALGAYDVFIGVNAIDYSGYPDCRPEFVMEFEKLANVATREGVSGRKFRIHAPLLRLTKSEIVRLGVSLGVDYALTLSCYNPKLDGRPCGRCASCALREKGFSEAGTDDPLTKRK